MQNIIRSVSKYETMLDHLRQAARNARRKNQAAVGELEAERLDRQHAELRTKAPWAVYVNLDFSTAAAHRATEDFNNAMLAPVHVVATTASAPPPDAALHSSPCASPTPARTEPGHGPSTSSPSGSGDEEPGLVASPIPLTPVSDETVCTPATASIRSPAGDLAEMTAQFRVVQDELVEEEMAHRNCFAAKKQAEFALSKEEELRKSIDSEMKETQQRLEQQQEAMLRLRSKVAALKEQLAAEKQAAVVRRACRSRCRSIGDTAR